MRKINTVFFLSLALVLCMSLHAQAVNVDIYSGFTTFYGGGAPYTGLVGSFTSADVNFATNTGYSWYPFNIDWFGADITGCLIAMADGMRTFTLNSDDGSLLLIDGNLVVDNGGPHAPQIGIGSTFLSAGLHSFEVQFFNVGGLSGVDLYLPCGVEYATCPAPLPSSLFLFAPGLLGLLGLRKRHI